METDRTVECVCRNIAQKFLPYRIILFNYKQSVSGEAKSFKICVIKNTDNKDELERSIYLEIESDIPYDILIYTLSEWSALSREKGSFAYQIREKGTVVYEQAP